MKPVIYGVAAVGAILAYRHFANRVLVADFNGYEISTKQGVVSIKNLKTGEVTGGLPDLASAQKWVTDNKPSAWTSWIPGIGDDLLLPPPGRTVTADGQVLGGLGYQIDSYDATPSQYRRDPVNDMQGLGAALNPLVAQKKAADTAAKAAAKKAAAEKAAAAKLTAAEKAAAAKQAAVDKAAEKNAANLLANLIKTANAAISAATKAQNAANARLGTSAAVPSQNAADAAARTADSAIKRAKAADDALEAAQTKAYISEAKAKGVAPADNPASTYDTAVMAAQQRAIADLVALKQSAAEKFAAKVSATTAAKQSASEKTANIKQAAADKAAAAAIAKLTAAAVSKANALSKKAIAAQNAADKLGSNPKAIQAQQTANAARQDALNAIAVAQDLGAKLQAAEDKYKASAFRATGLTPPTVYAATVAAAQNTEASAPAAATTQTVTYIAPPTPPAATQTTYEAAVAASNAATAAASENTASTYTPPPAQVSTYDATKAAAEQASMSQASSDSGYGPTQTVTEEGTTPLPETVASVQTPSATIDPGYAPPAAAPSGNSKVGIVVGGGILAAIAAAVMSN